MADARELKPKSFRIDDETADKFKEIASSLGGSQQETLAKLIEAFEFQQGKAILTERKSDIEQFEKYTNCLVRMFMGVLEDNQNITETVRTEFDALLKSKDTIIQNLQEQISATKQAKEEAVNQKRVCEAQSQQLQQALDRLNTEYNSKMDDMESMLADKDKLNKALTDSHSNLKAKVESMLHDVEQVTELKNALADLQKEYNALKAKSDSLEADLSHEKAKHEECIVELKKHESDALKRVRAQEEIARDKALLELEKKYQEQIQHLKAEKQAEVDKYQQKYFDLLEQIKNNSATVE